MQYTMWYTIVPIALCSTGVQDVEAQPIRSTEVPRVPSTAYDSKSRGLWQALQIPNSLGGSHKEYTAVQLRVTCLLHPMGLQYNTANHC